MHIWETWRALHLYVDLLDWLLPACVSVTLDGNVAEVHNVAAGNLLMDTCRASYIPQQSTY
jgi:hypothetical protein